MKTCYEASDGKIFYDEFDCLVHEILVENKEVFNIVFYTKFGFEYYLSPININKVLDDDVYYNCCAIKVHNEEELKGLKKLAYWHDWWELENYITEPGYWIRTNEEDWSKPNWVKVSNQQEEIKIWKTHS